MERRTVSFGHLDEAVADVRTLAASGYERAGNWSLAQNLGHLNKTMRMSIEGTTFGLPKILRPLLRWFIFSKMKRGDVIRFRASAPAPLRPEDDIDTDAAIAEFAELAARIESPDETLQPVHPMFGPFSREDWLAMHRWHSAHHLSFLVPKSAG